MKLTFHGAARTVTGSQHLVEIDGHRILLDCGLFQGRRKQAFELNRTGFCSAAKIDTVVLSHAHIDHSGNLPCLVRNGFKGKIYATSATQDLCAVMLQDSASIQERDVKYVNKKRKRQGKKLFEPLYTKVDATKTMHCFVGLSYNTPLEIASGVTLIFPDAGHMLGSAHVVLDIEENSTKEKRRLVFSGDIGRNNLPILKDPEPINEGADILIMESTYGNRNHPPESDLNKELEDIVNRTIGRGGNLIIPAFAIGRTQQIIFSLNQLYSEGKIPSIPVYVDSPLAINATEIFKMHPKNYDEETLDFMENGDSPFRFGALHYTRSVEDSKRINRSKDPAIIISASGMMEHGRILHHLKSRISDSRNTILVTGWQAPHTLGRKIIEGAKIANIFGEKLPVKAEIKSITGLSGHADHDELLKWAGAMNKKPQHTFIVHGEIEAQKTLAETLSSKLGFTNVAIPEMHESFII